MGTSNITGTLVSSDPTGNNWIIARDAIITAALKKIGGVGLGETASANQITEGAEALNALVKEWANDDIQLWNQTWNTTALSNGTASYALGSTVLTVDKAFVRDSAGYDYKVELITPESYFDIGKKTDTGRPQFIAPVWTNTNEVTLYCYPVPDASYTLHYLATIRLLDFDATGDNPDLPVRWELALIYGLAELMATDYGLPMPERQELNAKATKYRERAKNGAKQVFDDNFVDPAY